MDITQQIGIVGGKGMGKFIVSLISVPLMIVALVCVLFSDKIDTAVQGNKEVKKVIVVFGVGTLLVCTFAIVVSILALKIQTNYNL